MKDTGSASIEEMLGPLNVAERKNAAKTLHWQGDRSLLQRGARVAIVGSRRASPRGIADASALACWMAGHGVVVVSGLAEGIDTAAHRATIATAGRTIAVLGTPLDDCFPTINRQLQEEIGTHHLLLSQFPQGSVTTPRSFPVRNRTMALVADATFIIEAGEKSGTIHQGWEALRLGRPVFFMRCLLELQLPWVSELTAYGAQALDLDTLEAVKDYLPERPSAELPAIPA